MRYALFTGPQKKQLPHFIEINSTRIIVKYTGSQNSSLNASRAWTSGAKYRPMGFWTSPQVSSAAANTEPMVVNMSEPSLRQSSFVHRGIQTDFPGQSMQCQESLAKLPSTRTIGTMTLISGQSVDAETNTEHDVADRTTQTLTLEKKVKECRKCPRKKIICKKRKRHASAQGFDITKHIKSRDMCVETVTKSFQAKHPKLCEVLVESEIQQNRCPTCYAHPIVESDFKFEFTPKVSTETSLCLVCYKLDSIDRCLNILNRNSLPRTGEG